MKINPNGNPTSKVWVVIEKPYDNDLTKGFIFSGAYGWHFDKIMKEAGIPEYYVTCYKPDNALAYDDTISIDDLATEINRYKPPFIIFLGEKATGGFLPQTRSFKKPFKPRVESFAGSLLVSPLLNYDHYCICTHPPDFICGGNWNYRDIQINLDIGKIREELVYYLANGKLDSLPNYDIIVNPTFEQVMDTLASHEFTNANYLSTDIETIMPRRSKKAQAVSLFKGNPGYPYLLGIAPSSKRAISFSLWNYSETELPILWKATNNLLRSIPQIGQNYYNFDSHYLEALGLRLCLERCQDTLIRHHILWPEMPHSLQFLTKQYTRQPYYKDEGKGFIPKGEAALLKYMRYNALDCCVTYAVFEGQEQEFNDRPHLR